MGKTKELNEGDFVKCVLELADIDKEKLDRLHRAAHDVISELQGDMKITEAAARYRVFGHLLTVELLAFKAVAVKYKREHDKETT
jgi:predicted transcriptional regulator